MTQHLTQADLLKLISNVDLPAFKAKLGIPKNLTGKELIEEVERFSRSSFLSALLAVNSDSIRMLSDIARFLDGNNVNLRTTGFTLALANEIETFRYNFSPQLTGLLTDFRKLRLTEQSILDWKEALQQWDNELHKWIRSIVAEGEPESFEEIDTSSWAINEALGLPTMEVPYLKYVTVKPSALTILIQLWRTLDFLNHKLSVTSVDRSQIAGQLIAKLAKAGRFVGEAVKRAKRAIRQVRLNGGSISPNRRYLDDMKPWSKDWSQEQLFQIKFSEHMVPKWERWVAFIESILLLAEHQITEGTAELLKVNLLKDRPRLFELWLLTQIADTYRQRGYKVSLSSIKLIDERLTWWLNYAYGAEPICEIQDANSYWKLYYQWFVKGTQRANMPDIALVDAREKQPRVIWIVDPKYSEKGGYSRADYEEVARRYEEAFDAKAVWVCEYFRREDTFAQIWESVTERAVIITDTRPDGSGFCEIRRRISELHWMACSA